MADSSDNVILNTVCCLKHIWHTQYFTTSLYSCLNLTDWLLRSSRLLRNKLTGPQLVKEFPAPYETSRFVTAFTSVRHLTLPRGRINLVHASPFYFLKINFNIIPHLCLGLPSDPFPSGIPTKILYAPLLSLSYEPHPYRSFRFNYLNNKNSEKYRSRRFLLHVISSFLGNSAVSEF